MAGGHPGADLHRLQPGHHQLPRLGRRDRRNAAGARARHRRARNLRAGRRGGGRRPAVAAGRRCRHRAAASGLGVRADTCDRRAGHLRRRPAGRGGGNRKRAATTAVRRLRRPALRPPAGRARRGRDRLGDPGDAGTVLHRRRVAPAGMAGAVPRHLFRLRRTRPAGLGGARPPPRQGARLDGKHGAGDRQLRLGLPARRRRRHRLRPDLRRQWRRAGRRTGAAAGAAGRPAGRVANGGPSCRTRGSGRRRLLRRLEFRHQVQPRAGRRHRPAAGRALRLQSRRPTGDTASQGLVALAATYALLPAAIKVISLLLLWRWRHQFEGKPT